MVIQNVAQLNTKYLQSCDLLQKTLSLRSRGSRVEIIFMVESAKGLINMKVTCCKYFKIGYHAEDVLLEHCRVWDSCVRQTEFALSHRRSCIWFR